MRIIGHQRRESCLAFTIAVLADRSGLELDSDFRAIGSILVCGHRADEMLVMIARRNHDVGQLMLADGLDQALARRTIAVPEVCREARLGGIVGAKIEDRKSTRLNSSH